MSRPQPAEPRSWPASLAPGAVVTVVGPSGPVDADRLEAGAAVIASWGLTLRYAAHVRAAHDHVGYLAGDDRLRAADFAAAWTDPDTAAVWAARGGYGAQRMVDLIDLDLLRAAGPKHFIGFSDITALHSRLGRELGQVTVHGPVAGSVEQLSDEETGRSLRQLIMTGPEPGLGLASGCGLVPGRAAGRLWGGNLSLLASDVGIEPAPAGPVIMVIEEVGEDGYRVDRMLTQLRRAGWLDRVSGVVVGDLGDDRLAPAVLRHCLADLGVPLVVDVPVGHGTRNLALPLGAEVELDVDASLGSLRLAGRDRTRELG
jgi:muramoyltetrapeptide carboxypeptidase